MAYTLSRKRDNAGDAGHVSMALWEEDGEIKTEQDARPRVGVCIQVGSAFARTMEWQDYWQTSYITEIVEDTPKKVIFKTGNSIYTWTC